MRARRREINIFNMSLLDILCGALGAFCFMMLVALPYYKPPGSAPDLKKAQEETQRLMRDLEKMTERLPDQKSIEEMEELLRRLEAQVKALQGQVNILTAEKEELERRVTQLSADNELLKTTAARLQGEKEQLQARVNQLTAEKQELMAKNLELTAAYDKLLKQFQLTRIFSVVARAENSSSNIEMLFSFTAESQKVGTHSGFNDWLRGSYDPGNPFRDFLFGRGTAVQEKYFGTVGTQHFIYLKNAASPERREVTVIDSALMSDFHLVSRLPRVTLTPERYWALLGTITIDQTNVPIFKEATAAERDAEWTAVTNSSPPPTPTPTPPPSAESLKAAAEARAQRKEFSDKFRRLIRLENSNSGEDKTEILKFSDELLKELPPGDPMRRHVESIREHALALKSQKEREQQPQSGPAPSVAPSRQPPPRPPSPVTSPAP